MGKLAFLFLVNWDLKDYGLEKKLGKLGTHEKNGQNPSRTLNNGYVMGIIENRQQFAIS